jgi:hypothetical protein
LADARANGRFGRNARIGHRTGYTVNKPFA